MSYPRFPEEAALDEAFAQLRTDKIKLSTALQDLTRAIDVRAPLKVRMDCATQIESAKALLREMGVA